VSDEMARLEAVLKAQQQLVYAFAAHADGRIIGECGDRGGLPEVGIVDVVVQPEHIRVWHEELKRREREDSRLVPQLYAQGRVQCVIGAARPALLVFLFAVMPETTWSSTPEARVAWISRNRKDTWHAVVRAWSTSQAGA
jgi:hypothetical protein